MDAVQRFTSLKEQIDQLSATKIRAEERYKAEREKLEKLLAEITAKGYDPTKLAETKAAKEAELDKTFEELSAKVGEASSKLSAIGQNL